MYITLVMVRPTKTSRAWVFQRLNISSVFI
jgi:hypothetical protein